MNVTTAQVGEMRKWSNGVRTEGRVNDRLKECIAQRTSENIKCRYMRIICGVDNVRIKRDIYEKVRGSKRGSLYGFTCL